MTESATRDIAALLRERVVPPGGSRHGLVVGIEQYRDARLNLRCAAADAKAIFDLMTDPDCGMFPEENVRLLLNEEATRDGIWRALSALRPSAGENDTVWVYYAGHAAPEESSLYWVTHDADVDDLYGTGLSNDQISKVLGDIPAQRLLVLLDCCHAAATAAQKNPTRAILTADEVLSCFKGHGRITLSSSDGKEKSVELGDVGHGAFTYFLEQGLRGDADADGDGIVTADELWGYLRSKVVDASQKAGNAQTPVLLGEMRHDFALSLNPLEFGRRSRIANAIRNLVGVGADQLTTEEGRKCLELLRRDARNDAERDLMAEFASLPEGRLRISTLRRLIDDVSEATAATAPVPAGLPPVAASASAGPEEPGAPAIATEGECKITCPDDFAMLPGKYQWNRTRTLEVINRWSSKYLGVLSNLAERCEVLDLQAHGYLSWHVEVLVERRQWAKYRKGVNTANPSGVLDFLARKPLQLPELTPEIAKRLAEICPDCHGTGEYICPHCFGRGRVQCQKCEGIGKEPSAFKGDYLDRQCDRCHGDKDLPCTMCKGVPKHACAACNGLGLASRRHIPSLEFPVVRSVATLWTIEGGCCSDAESAVVRPEPESLERCGHCNGSGQHVCKECFGEGKVQCSKCEGVGKEPSAFKGDYLNRKCDRCHGAKVTPCTACKGVPKRRCEACGGGGVVAVYPAIKISRTTSKVSETSVPGVSLVGTAFTVSLARIEGGAGAVPEKAAGLLDRFEGAKALRGALAYSPKDKNAKITKVVAKLRWYPYMLCKMKYGRTGTEFVLGVNCTCGTVFRVHGKCPKGESFWSWLFGWASRPFDKTAKGEPEFMLKQMQHKGSDEARSDCL